jgi:hypothetical protein
MRVFSRRPMRHQRPVRTIQRIGQWERHAGDVPICTGAFTWRTRAGVPLLPPWIGPYGAEILTGMEAFVRYASRNDDNVTRLDLHHYAVLAATLQRGTTAKHAQYFMGGAMIMVVAKNTRAPCRWPVIGRKQRCKLGSKIAFRHSDRLTIHYQRQFGIVGEHPIIGKRMQGDLRQLWRIGNMCRLHVWTHLTVSSRAP